MSRITKLFAANAIAAAGICSAALAFSPAAAADPAIPPIVPGVPGLSMLQQFATNPASAAALLQSAATALSGATALTGGTPATSGLPVSPIAGAPATAPLPAAPAAPAAGTSLLPIPLLNQLGVPGNLANLTPSDVPFPIAVGGAPSIATPPPNAPGQVPPASNPPIAATTPGGAGLGQLLPLSALP